MQLYVSPIQFAALPHDDGLHVEHILRSEPRRSRRAVASKYAWRPISISQSATIKCQERTVKSYVFEVVIEEDQFEDGRPGFSAHCPSIEGAYTWGETRDQALERIQESVKLILDEMRDEGKPVPPNSAVMELESPAVLVTV